MYVYEQLNVWHNAIILCMENMLLAIKKDTIIERVIYRYILDLILKSE